MLIAQRPAIVLSRLSFYEVQKAIKMALIILGKTPCPLCEQPIKETDELVSFPAFISNQLDPLFPFSDAAFHAACFHQHPLSAEAEVCYAETVKRAEP
jgi:hypothetical protein